MKQRWENKAIDASFERNKPLFKKVCDTFAQAARMFDPLYLAVRPLYKPLPGAPADAIPPVDGWCMLIGEHPMEVIGGLGGMISYGYTVSIDVMRALFDPEPAPAVTLTTRIPDEDNNWPEGPALTIEGAIEGVPFQLSLLTAPPPGLPALHCYDPNRDEWWCRETIDEEDKI
jgi:hypothetical protein